MFTVTRSHRPPNCCVGGAFNGLDESNGVSPLLRSKTATAARISEPSTRLNPYPESPSVPGRSISASNRGPQSRREFS